MASRAKPPSSFRGLSMLPQPRLFPRTLPAVVLLAALLGALCGPLSAAAQTDTDPNTAGNSCQPVLLDGVSNTLMSVTPATSDYFSIQQAACLDYSSYTFTTYNNDMSAGGAGDAASLNLAAKAFGWAGPAAAAGAAYRITTESQFNSALAKAAAYRATACGYSSVNAASDQNVAALSQFINPSVYGAYVSCLRLYAAGVRVSQTSGFASKSVSVDVKFVPLLPGTKAALMGLSIFPPKAATCTMYRGDVGIAIDRNLSPPPPSLAPPADPFRLELAPYMTYTIFCQLNTAAANGVATLFTDVSISTSFGTFKALLNNKAAPNTPEIVTRLTTVETKTTQLDTRVRALEGKPGRTGRRILTKQEQEAAK